MEKTLTEIARILGAEIVGDGSVVIRGVSGIKEAKAGDITFVANPKYIPLIQETNASAIITSREVTSAPKPILKVENPSLAFAKVVSLVAPQNIKLPFGIHPTAVIGKNVKLGKQVALGPYVVVEDEAQIGDNTIAYAHCYIGYKAVVGTDCLLYPMVSLRENVSIGNRVVIHNGAVIGSDGFGFTMVDGSHQRIPQIGTVVIEDDVDIGANVTIDRARFEKTIIGKGTKIDNLVQIAHNCIIGRNCIIIAQAGVSGSTQVGDNVILAGQSGIVGHITIGDNAIVAAQAGVTKSVPAGTMVSGYPARPHDKAKRVNACIQRLPELYAKVEELQKKIEQLKQQTEK